MNPTNKQIDIIKDYLYRTCQHSVSAGLIVSIIEKWEEIREEEQNGNN